MMIHIDAMELMRADKQRRKCVRIPQSPTAKSGVPVLRGLHNEPLRLTEKQHKAADLSGKGDPRYGGYKPDRPGIKGEWNYHVAHQIPGPGGGIHKNGKQGLMHMGATYYQYWGKARKTADGKWEYHLLPYHCLDVAAVGRVWG